MTVVQEVWEMIKNGPHDVIIGLSRETLRKKCLDNLVW